MANRRNTEQDFWNCVYKHGPLFEGTPCWLWSATTRGDYGIIWFEGRQWLAHRLAFTLQVWPIGEGLHIHHRCENRLCVNPLHLQEVTRRQHLLLTDNMVSRNVTKTECDHGHPFTPENTHLYRGKRVCIACARDYCRRLRDKYRQHAFAPRRKRKT